MVRQTWRSPVCELRVEMVRGARRLAGASAVCPGPSKPATMLTALGPLVSASKEQRALEKGIGGILREEGIDFHGRQSAASIGREVESFRLDLAAGQSGGRDQLVVAV